ISISFLPSALLRFGRFRLSLLFALPLFDGFSALFPGGIPVLFPDGIPALFPGGVPALFPDGVPALFPDGVPALFPGGVLALRSGRILASFALLTFAQIALPFLALPHFFVDAPGFLFFPFQALPFQAQTLIAQMHGLFPGQASLALALVRFPLVAIVFPVGYAGIRFVVMRVPRNAAARKKNRRQKRGARFRPRP
ncbi:MAG: hypothetical protein LBE85_03945, partial [Candidatus Accumulibacter sp.]|nr:hypothetical protein [Accumulibacter sp.]